MEERYKLIVKNGKIHLFKGTEHFFSVEQVFDEDCGELSKTFMGKLETSNFLGLDYTLEEVSEFFSSDKKYKVEKSNGEKGIMTKRDNKDYYIYEPEKD